MIDTNQRVWNDYTESVFSLHMIAEMTSENY
jgi:hypothetical protein